MSLQTPNPNENQSPAEIEKLKNLETQMRELQLKRDAHLWEIRFTNLAVMVERYVDNPNESSLAALKTWRANQLAPEASNDALCRPGVGADGAHNQH